MQEPFRSCSIHSHRLCLNSCKAECLAEVSDLACLQDVIPVNGVAGTGPDAGKFVGEIHDCHFEIMASA